MPVKNVVPKDQCTRVSPEKVFRDEECLRDAFGPWLDLVLQPNSVLASVAQHGLKLGHVVGSRDEQDLANAGQHERAQRVVDQRLVVDGQQTLPDRLRHGIKTSSRSSRQNDALVSRTLVHVLALSGVVRRNPLTVTSTGDALHPALVFKIPAHCPAQATLQGLLRLPSQLALNLFRVHGIAAVMSWSILDK